MGGQVAGLGAGSGEDAGVNTQAGFRAMVALFETLAGWLPLVCALAAARRDSPGLAIVFALLAAFAVSFVVSIGVRDDRPGVRMWLPLLASTAAAALVAVTLTSAFPADRTGLPLWVLAFFQQSVIGFSVVFDQLEQEVADE